MGEHEYTHRQLELFYNQLTDYAEANLHDIEKLYLALSWRSAIQALWLRQKSRRRPQAEYSDMLHRFSRVWRDSMEELRCRLSQLHEGDGRLARALIVAELRRLWVGGVVRGHDGAFGVKPIGGFGWVKLSFKWERDCRACLGVGCETCGQSGRVMEVI